VALRVLLALVAVAAVARVAAAQAAPAPPAPPAPQAAPAPLAPPAAPAPPAPQAPQDSLHEANGAAAAGDWTRVAALIDPLLRGALSPTDLAEAYRLSGMAAFHLQRRELAEAHFLAYLKIDLDGRLDPALYPPEVVAFFEDVRVKHQAELRARRPKPRTYWLLNLIPPGGQIQNRHRVKAWVVGGLLGVFAAGNVTTYLVLRSWCTRVSGDEGSSLTCDDRGDHASSASTLRGINIATGIGLIVTYAYGVYDGATNYRRQEPMRPFVAAVAGGGLVGIGGSF